MCDRVVEKFKDFMIWYAQTKFFWFTFRRFEYELSQNMTQNELVNSLKEEFGRA